MKRRCLFPLAILANASMLALCLLSRHDIFPVVFLLPLFHGPLFALNLKAARRWWQVILLGLEHIAATVLTVIFDAWICRRYFGYDPADLVSSAIALEAGFAIAVILFVIHIAVFARRQKRQRAVT